jgi:hypothetical protein
MASLLPVEARFATEHWLISVLPILPPSSLGQQTDPDILQNGLSQLGLPDWAPKSRTWLVSLKAALAEMFAKPEELVRPRKHKQRNGYTVVIVRA